jgi:hypothetical protein
VVVVLPLVDIIGGEIKKALGSLGIKAEVLNIGNEIVVTIPSHEIIENIKKGFPEQYRPMVSVESGDIKIRVRIA